MSFDPNRPSSTTAPSAARVVDSGLQSYMQKVYNVMGIGLVIMGLTAFGVANTPAVANLIFGSPLMWVVMFAPLAFLMFGFTPNKIARMSSEKLKMVFFLFSAVMGLSMAAIFMSFTAESIARVFFITAAMFAATSLYGYTTKKDLSGVGAFLFMGLIGVFFASLINMFIQSSMLHFVVSVIGVIVFTGLAAWDTQRLKEMYSYAQGEEAQAKVAIMGSLSLYLSFVNLFQMLLHLMGNRE